jgi:Uncharacterized conserved protein
MDLAAGTNVIRWSVSGYYDTTNAGIFLLDEFNVLPPRPLAFTYESGDQTVYSGEIAGVSAWAIGTPPLFFQWRKDDEEIPGATNAWFSLDVATTNDSGNYSVVVSNSQGFIVSSNAALTVLPPTSPFFTFEPDDATAYVGQEINLGGSVSGSPPFTFQWRKDGTNLTEPVSSSWWGSEALSLANVAFVDAGNYTLFVTNAYGSVESSNAVVTILPSTAPIITRQPRSLEVAAGVTTWISAVGTGAPGPKYRWTQAGVTPPPPSSPGFPPLPPTGYFFPANYRPFSSVSNSNAGIYSVSVTNIAGAVVSRDALLTVLPAITNKSSWWQGAMDLFVTNDLVFLAQGSSGFSILSVSNLATPIMLGGYNTPGTASAVWVSGGLAYVADGAAGLQVFKVSNPFAPALLGTYNTAGYAYDVTVHGNLAYIADSSDGLVILDVNNPASPSLVGSYATNSFSFQRVCVSGNHAFVSSPSLPGMLVIDVTDAAHPFEVGRLTAEISDLTVRDQTVFAVGYDGLMIISITNIAQPTLLSAFTGYPGLSTSLSFNAVQVVNDLVYAAGTFSPMKLYVFDVRGLQEPIPVGYYTNNGNAQTLWVEGNRVYVSGTDGALEILETPFNTQPVSPPALSLAAQNGMKLLINGKRGLHYEVEYADGLSGFPWQPLQTILLTNQLQTVEVPSETGMRFFRLKQLD